MPEGKRALLLALGGTIACIKTGSGLAPRLRAPDLLAAVRPPDGMEVSGMDLAARTVVFPEDWIALAKAVFDRYRDCAGFVVTLGTDTLAYASAALSLMLGNLSKPVVLTGAMRPLSAARGDARRNLADAMRLAASGAGGVFVVFAGWIFDGGRVSKTRCDGPDAFESVNARPLGRMVRNRIHWRERPASAGGGGPRLDAAFDARVATLKLGPQTRPEDLAGLHRYRGVVVEGYGDGNVPSNLVPALRRLAARRAVVLASQCLRGRLRHAYEGGRALIRGGALSAGGMTKEMALVRLMWALGKGGGDPASARRLFRRAVK